MRYSARLAAPYWACSAAALMLTGFAAGQSASLSPSGYTETFDSMGSTGTAPPTGWRHFTANFGTNATWTGSIPANGASSAATMLVSTAGTTLTATTTPSGNNNNGFNAAASGGTPADRMLATSPTSIAGVILQLELSNQTGGELAPASILTLDFDIVRVNGAASQNDLPGYWLFVSHDGVAWSNITPNPNSASVPNSAGTTHATLSYTLASSWPAGASIYLRWIDDNATQTSPDQIYGLNNVMISAAPGNPNGRCCFVDGSCTTTTTGSCGAGTFTPGEDCEPNTCPQPPPVACCAPDGACAMVAPGQCTGGSFAAPDSVCTAEALCRQPGVTRFVVFGDYGVDNANQGAVAARMKTYNPEFMVTTGDNTYFTSTTISNFDNTQGKYYREFIKIVHPSSAWFGQGAAVNAFFPCMGNHDMDVGGGAANAIPYWNAYWELPGNERYYTFSKGPIDFFVLSSDSREPDSRSVGGTQHGWFTGAYSASTARYKIIVFHHPPYTNQTGHAGDATMAAWDFQGLPGVTAVLSGHNHNLQRLEVPRTGAGVGTGVGSTVPFLISGSAGQTLYDVTGASPYNAYYNDTDFGFLLIDAGTGSITFRFITVGGTVVNTHTLFQPGACCVGANCSITAGAACAGSYKGNGSACQAPGNPITCCRANFNQASGVTVQDLFDFLSAWFAMQPSADFNGVNAVTVQDLFDFLAAWLAGC